MCLIMTTLPSSAAALWVHIARQGETAEALAVEYYGTVDRALLLRALNRLPLEGEAEFIPGEPIAIPECLRRTVKTNESWRDVAHGELGGADRAWYLAKINGSTDDIPPEAGSIVTVPYFLSWSLIDGLSATIERFYPDLDGAERLVTARKLVRLNPDLQPRFTKGTRLILPFVDLNILPEKRAELERLRTNQPSSREQQEQQRATKRLAQLPALLSEGGYVEVVQLASRIVSSSPLTEAQRVTIHRYLGQALLALGRQELAHREFDRLLALQPDFQFDQVTTSPTVLEVLEKARRGRRAGPGASATKASSRPRASQ
jgi:hypothetical protein